jgi:hypothetical protein
MSGETENNEVALFREKTKRRMLFARFSREEYAKMATFRKKTKRKLANFKPTARLGQIVDGPLRCRVATSQGT